MLLTSPLLRLAALSLVVAGLAASPATTGPASATAASSGRHIAYTQWTGGAAYRSGSMAGVRVAHGRLVLATDSKGLTSRAYAGRRYDQGTWTSPWVSPGFGRSVGLTQLVSSWSATTPGDSWIQVRVRGRDASGTTSSWDVLGRWAANDRFVHRVSMSGQADDLASVDVDTWKAHAAAGLTSWQLEVSLLRVAGATTDSPAIDTVGAMASRLPAGTPVTSKPGAQGGAALGRVLDVPEYSQMIHQGYTQWGGGGEAWCSPTSVSMVLGYYHALPRPATYSWVGAGQADPWVDAAARRTYDTAYDGTGNWPFNTAYAAPLAGHAFVTRLRSLREAERFIAAGIPLVASISFGSGELSGAPISATQGHLVVIAGFTKTGDVVVDDPAAGTDAGVRRTYDRAEFERAWLTRSGGLVYVIHDDAHPLPGGAHRNW